MKISTEQLRAIQEQKALRANKQQPTQPGDFSELLTRHIEDDNEPPLATGLAKAAGPTGRVPPMPGVTADDQVDAADSIFEEAATNIDGMFDTLESYASQLANSGVGSLKEAYALLESIDGQVDAFKERFSDASAAKPQLADMVNELKVLTTTEAFKFNRGDYI